MPIITLMVAGLSDLAVSLKAPYLSLPIEKPFPPRAVGLSGGFVIAG